MRVTVVSRIYLPEPAAASFRLGALVRELDAAGHAVTVLTTRAPGDVDADVPFTDAADVRRWPVLRDKTGYVRGYLPYLSFDAPVFFRLLFARRPNVVVAEPPPTTGLAVRLACALRRLPYVYYAADVWSDASMTTGAPDLVIRVLRGIERFALRGASSVLAVSAGVRQRVSSLAPQADVVEIGNGIDTEIFGRNRTSETVDDESYLVYAGTASEWHGAMVFLEALPQVLTLRPEVRLVFVGQGSDWQQIAERGAQFGAGVVTVLPRVDGSAAADFLSRARAALSSVRPGTPYEFAFPTKAYASMACGTPVLYVGAGVAGEQILASGFGWACAYDVDAVADAMVQAWDNKLTPAERRSLTQWARGHVSSSAVAAKAVTVIASASQRAARGAA